MLEAGQQVEAGVAVEPPPPVLSIGRLLADGALKAGWQEVDLGLLARLLFCSPPLRVYFCIPAPELALASAFSWRLRGQPSSSGRTLSAGLDPPGAGWPLCAPEGLACSPLCFPVSLACALLL